MTLRLVGLISVVLVLSLAAFGLLVQHYQEQLMQEVGRTALEVGRATLRTLDWTEDPAGPGTETLRRIRRAPAVDAIPGAEVPSSTPAAGNPGDPVVIVREFDDSGSPRSATEGAPRHAEWIGVTAISAPPGALPETLRTADCPTVAGGVREENEFYIDVDDVRAESDPGQGLVLRIPRFASPEAGDSARRVQYHMQVLSGDRIVTSRRQDIRLPVPLGAYGDLFDGLRRRSILLCLGVFAVGMLLTIGIATRFTRPIRKLDAGLRRLSAGDLDVSVEVEGKDEMARLSRVFNEMAGRLRANRERERDMVRREKLSALGRLAAGVAHDVRNPLHSIGLTLQHLTETARPDSPERAVEFDRSLDIIRGEIRRLDQLVGNFLRFARTERREREWVDLAQVVSETVRLVQKEGERRGVELTVEVDESSPQVRADGEALRSSLLNLVLNGFEAMPTGGRLTIRLRGEQGGVSLEVADTGEGIAEGDRERVFEFSYTTREGGNGLGLAMVHHCIVEEHGGRVSLESQEGEGTCVRLLLPAGELAS